MNDWRTARGCEGGACVEVGNGILVRDSEDRGGPELRFAAGAWRAFTAALKGSAA